MRKRLDHSLLKLSWREKDSEIFRASGWRVFLDSCLQVSLQPIRQRGGPSQVPVQAVGGTWFDRCSPYQSHSSRQPAWFHPQHHHWQIRSPVFPAKRDPLWPAGAERRAKAAVPLRRLLCCWKSAGTAPTWADLSPDQRLFYPSGCCTLLSHLLPFTTFVLSAFPSPQWMATERSSVKVVPRGCGCIFLFFGCSHFRFHNYCILVHLFSAGQVRMIVSSVKMLSWFVYLVCFKSYFNFKLKASEGKQTSVCLTGVLSENKAANQQILSPLMALLESVLEQDCKLFIKLFEAYKSSRRVGNDSCLLGAYIHPTHRP